MTLDIICGEKTGPFWDWNTTWYTDYPHLSECFTDTLPLWIPCGIFISFFAIEYVQLKKIKNYPSSPWIFYDYARISLLGFLFCCIIIRIIGKSVFWFKGDYDWFFVGQASYSIQLLTVLAIFVTTYCRQCRLYTCSAVSWITIFGFFLCGSVNCAVTIQLLTRIPLYNMPSPIIFDSISYLIYYGLVIANLVFMSFSSVRNDYVLLRTVNDGDQPIWPEEFYSFPNQLFYWWFKSLPKIGYKKNLEIKDVWFVHKNDQTGEICSKFVNALDKEYGPAVAEKMYKPDINCEIDAVAFSKPKNPSLVKVLLKCFGLKFLYITIMIIVFALLSLSEVLMFGYILRYAQNVSSEPVWHGFFYVTLLALIFVFRTFLDQRSLISVVRIGTRIRSGLMSIIYRKALRLSPDARKLSTLGETVNLMSVDASKFRDASIVMYYIIPAPIVLVLGYVYLYQLVGIAGLSGFVLTILIFLINFFFSGKFKKWQTSEMRLKDDRLKIISEIINGIKVLKFYAWELAFQKKVENVRRQELVNKKKSSYFSGIFEVALKCTVLLSSFATFATFVLINPDGTLTPEIVFVSLTIFQTINLFLQNMPQAVMTMIATKVSYNRIDNFLRHQEMEIPLDMNYPSQLDSNFGAQIENADFSWSTNAEPILKNINMQIPKGCLVAVVGKVGCGKSSLLNALCGEMFCLKGSFVVNGSIGYVQQQAWIQNMTLRDNVLFDKELDVNLYNKILDSCALRSDLEILPAGDFTEIGERGINLSGGQKMRVSLARAIYQNKEIYLLDDPLAAVDVHVGKHIFQEVIGSDGLLADKTRIMVTHNLTYLSQCNLIIVMKDGRVDRIDTFKNLKNDDIFSELLNNTKDPTIDEKIERKALKTPAEEEIKVDRPASSIKKDESRGVVAEEKGKLIKQEKLETENVAWSIYWTYALACGVGLLCFVCLLCFAETCQLLSIFWLQRWSDSISKSSANHTTDDVISTSVGLRNYGLLGLGQIIFTVALIVCYASFQVKASRMLHTNLLKNLLRAPMSFFETTPTGRIINRFGKDMNAIDESIPNFTKQFLNIVFQTLRCVVAVSIVAPYFLLVLVPFTVCYIFAQRFYVRTSRQLRRLEAVCRSPIFSHFQETLQGLSTIRVFRQQQRLISQLERLIDINSSIELVNRLANRWIAIYLNLGGNCLTCLVAFFVVWMVQHGRMTGGLAGLALSYALAFTGYLTGGVWISGILETEMVAVERIKEYTDIESEAEWETVGNVVPLSWPQNGKVEFVNYSTRYRPDLPTVLSDLTCALLPCEKVGVVGRTGAGKSSLTLGLFRLIEAASGKILIDDIDISRLGLHEIRRKLTIIPQEPVLFSGNLRLNLDPFNTYSDDELWRALELSNLKSFVANLPDKMSHQIGEGGANLSVGQRQLLCLARAVLRKSKILILDEATAAVDMETDCYVQETIREHFKDCTVITVAHRINTVLDYDKIMVFDNGRLREFDTPENLLASDESMFAKMVREIGNVATA